MKKFAKLLDKPLVTIFLGTDTEWAVQNGFQEMDVEQGYDGNWYLFGHVPAEAEKSYIEKRLAEYPTLSDQLDMIYWDKINGTNLWQNKITEIKTKYPKS